MAAERFGDVAAPLERFDEDAVRGLAEGREVGQHPGAFLGLRQRRAAESEAGGGNTCFFGACGYYTYLARRPE